MFAQFSSIFLLSCLVFKYIRSLSFVKYEQDLPISFAYLFAQLLGFQLSIASYYSNKAISAYVCSVAWFASIFLLGCSVFKYIRSLSFVKYRQDLPISFAYLFAQLLGF